MFSLSLRDVELLRLNEVVASYETVGAGARNSAKPLPTVCAAAGPGQRTKSTVFIRIQGVQHYLWRAVDQEGVALDILVQPRRVPKQQSDLSDVAGAVCNMCHA